MLLKLVTLAALAQANIIRRTDNHRQCGSRDFIQEIDATLESQIAQSIASGNVEEEFGRSQEVVCNFHIIQQSDTVGLVTDEMITDQMKVLNDDYTDFTFTLNTTTRTVNSSWYTVGYDTRAEAQMKKALRLGDATTLNIYLANLGGGLLGWATFPSDLQTRAWRDGVVVHSQSLPGGNLAPYNLGRTLTHEAGHWFGLWHTFQDGCSYPNDFVEDTIAEKRPAFGCPKDKKSCTANDFSVKDRPYFNATDASPLKTDPVTNFMDYTDDACMTSFSAGQYLRTKAQWLLRVNAPKIVVEPEEITEEEEQLEQEGALVVFEPTVVDPAVLDWSLM